MINQHGRDHETEQHWCQDTALLHSIGDRKGLERLTIVLDSYVHAVMELLHHEDLNFRGHPYLAMIFSRPSLRTMSKALVRST